MKKTKIISKKWFALIMAITLCAGLVAGCGNAQGAAVDETAAVAETVSEAGAAGVDAVDAADAGSEAESGPADGAGSEEADADEQAQEAAVEETAEDVVVRVGGLKGPTTMGLVKLMDDAKNGLSENQYEFTMVTAADELTGLVASGKVDIALLPANVASILYHKTEGGVSVIDINTLGVLYLVSADTSVSSIEDLKGRTIYLPGKGTTPEYALRYLISAAGLGESDVTLEFKSEAAEVASILAEEPDALGLLPQPFVTSALSQNDALSIILDLTAAWDSYQTEENPSRLVTGVTIVNTEFLKAHKDIVDTFIKEHAASAQFTEQDPATAAALIEEAGIVAKAAVAQKALPYCNITCITGADMKDALSGYLGALLEQAPESVGGALPDDAFYYIP